LLGQFSPKIRNLEWEPLGATDQMAVARAAPSNAPPKDRYV